MFFKRLLPLFLLLACGGSIETETSSAALRSAPIRPITILCLGDSLTAGSHYDESDLTHPKIAWRGSFLSEVARRYGVEIRPIGNEEDQNPPTWWPSIDWHHAGVGGELVDDPRHLKASILSMRQRVVRELPRNRPDIVIVLGGLNDVATGYSVAEAIDHLYELVADIHRLVPEAKVVASTVTTYPPKLVASLELNEAILRIRSFRTFDTTSGLIHPNDFASDNIHPNRRGYGMIGVRFADEIETTLLEVLFDRSKERIEL